jgi:hypothetical protein
VSKITSYQDFQQRVRRFRPSDLLPAVGATSIEFFEKDSWGRDRLRVPWALAEIAKASIVAGNEFRSAKVTERDIVELCFEYSSLDDPLRQKQSGLPGTLEAFMVRLQFMQFGFQLSPFEEVARVTALFDDVDRLDTKIISTEFINEMIGCTLHEYVNAGVAICSVAQKNRGFFDPSWDALWKGPNSIHERFSMDIVTKVFQKHYLTDFGAFKGQALEFRQDEPSLRQYEYNPLIGRPFVKMSHGSFLAPQIHLAYGRMAPAAIYYSIVSDLDDIAAKKFTEDIGLIFQHYVGRQLDLIPGATLVEEIHYDNDQRSVDWFLVTEGALILIEAKATRMSHLGRMGADQLGSDIDRCLGLAQRQIERSNRLIRDRHSAFESLPKDLPRFGLTVTLEPYWATTNPYIDRLVAKPSIPSATLSSRQLEQLVAESIGRGNGSMLTDFLSTSRTTSIEPSESGDTSNIVRNPILDSAWKSNPLWDAIFEID